MDAQGKQNEANIQNQIKKKLRGSLMATLAFGQIFSILKESHPKAAMVGKSPSSVGHWHLPAAAPEPSPTETSSGFSSCSICQGFILTQWEKHTAFGAQAAPNWDQRGHQLLSLCSAKPCDGKRICGHARMGQGSRQQDRHTDSPRAGSTGNGSNTTPGKYFQSERRNLEISNSSMQIA